MNTKLSLILWITILLIEPGIVNAQLIPPSNYTLIKDLSYKQAGDWTGRLDLYAPKKGARKMPLLIFIHGGGWVHGKKEQETAFAMFFEKDFVVANIEYRVTSQATAPAAIEDSRCALTYLVNRADSFRIDRKKIIVMGISAGAHLALMTGFTAQDSVARADCAPGDNKKFKIAAVIDMSGPSDLHRWDAVHKEGKASRDWLGGRENDSAFVSSLSPVSYIRRTSPPVFIIHGEKDRTVPLEQSLLLYDALKNVGVKTELRQVKNAGHSISLKDKEQLKQPVFDFLRKIKVL